MNKFFVLILLTLITLSIFGIVCRIANDNKQFEKTATELYERRQEVEVEKNKKVNKKLKKYKKTYIISNEEKENVKIVQDNPTSQELETPDIIVQIKEKKKLNGYAKYCWSNGDCYTGYWKDGYMDGGGCYEWADGVKCIDQFIKGFPVNEYFEYGKKTYRIKK